MGACNRIFSCHLDGLKTFITFVSCKVHSDGRFCAGLLLVLASLAPVQSFAFTVPAADYDGTYTITWDSNPPANSGGYTALLQRFNGGSWATIDTGGFGSESYTVTVSTSGTYDYRMDYYYMPPNPCQYVPPGGSCNPQLSGPHSSAIQTTIVALTAPAGAPTLSVPANSNTGNYTVSWSAVFGTATYELQEKIGAGSWGNVTLTNPTDTSKPYPSQPSNSYRYRVRACNPHGCTAYSPESPVDVAITPGMPASITVPTSATDGNFNVSWSSVSGTVTAYELEQQLNSGSWTSAYTGTALSTAISGLSAGSYVYRVRACNTAGGYSSCSGYRTSSTVTVAAPANVPILSVPATSHNGSYTVSWNSVANIGSYTLQEKIGAGGWTTVQDTAATSRPFSGKGNNSYRYRVRACNAIGCTAYSSEPMLIVAITPGVPASISVPPTVVSGALTVSWGASSGTFSYYELEEKQNSANWADRYNGLLQSQNLTSLTAGSYLYRVRACVTVSSYINCSNWREGSNAAVAPYSAFDFASEAPAEFQYNLNDTSFLPDLGTGEFVALTQGAADVNNGAAQYSVPVALPPAVNNLKPDLALTYNSRGDNGLMGVGWSLSGLSTIGRCSPTVATEGSHAQDSNPRYTNADRLCLDGQKLEIASSTTPASDSAYWAAGAEYRTEIDTFARIKAYGSHNGAHQYFEVRTKDGRILTYGRELESQNSRIYAPGQGSGGPVSVWALDKVQDRYGNPYTIHYQRNNLDGDYYPEYIAFEPNALVYFAYENRDGDMAGDLSDMPWGYDKGYFHKHPKLLDKITTYINVTNPSPVSGTKVQEYEINYTRSVTTDRYLVSDISECGFNGSTRVCADPLTFAWQAGELGFETSAITLKKSCTGDDIATGYLQVGDIDNDGYDDLLSHHEFVTSAVFWGGASCFTQAGSWATPGGVGWRAATMISTPRGKALVITQQDTSSSDHFIKVIELNRATSTNNIIQLNSTALAPTAIMVVDLNNDGLEDILFGTKAWVQQNTNPVSFTQVNDVFNGTPDPWLPEGVFGDYNSDGLADFMGVSQAYNNLGNHHFASDFALPSSDATGTPIHGYGGMQIGSLPGSQFHNIQDINGDGLRDVVWHRKPVSGSSNPGYWYVKLNTGNGVGAQIDSGISSGTQTNQYSFTYDWDKDGRQDPIVPTTADPPTWRIFLSTYNNGGFAFKEVTSPHPFNGNLNGLASMPIGTSTALVFRGDFNNDGLIDLSSGTSVWYAKQQQPDLLQTVTDGFGAEVKFDYSPLVGTSNNGQPLYTQSSNVVFPQRHSRRDMQVVKKLSTSDGLGGYRHLYFNYTGAKEHAQGRGFLGFEKIVVTDTSSGTVATTHYRQDYPFIGLVAFAETKDSAGKLISITDNDYQIHGTNARFPYLNYSIEREYGLTATSAGSPLSVIKTQNTFDQYGNLTGGTTTVGTGLSGTSVTGVKRVVTVSNTITNNITDWLLGFVEESIVNSSIDGTTGQRTVETEFDPQSGTLDVAVRRDFVGTSVCKTTSTTRNGYGVVTEIEAEACDLNTTTTAARTTTLSNFTDIIYPGTRTNGLGHQTTLIYDERFGVVDGETDSNNLTTSKQYDFLAREIATTAPGGTATSTIRYECVAAPVICPAAAVYFVATKVTNAAAAGKLGVPLSIVYYDMLQREVRKETYSLDGAVIKVDTQYYADGRLHRVSEPFTGSTAADWTVHADYDALDRPFEVIGPDGGSMENIYSQETGLAKTITTVHVITPGGSDTQVTTRYIDALGQVKQVIDAHNTPIDYIYDTHGNLASTTVNNSSVTTVSITHDVAGNKIYINDPDAGVIDFEYNGFGELRRQTWQKNTGNEKSMTFTYDVLGRKTGRIDDPVVGSNISYAWTWDTVKQGLLTSQSGNGVTETYTYDSLSRPQSLTTSIAGLSGSRVFGYTYDAFSRPLTVTYPDGLVVEYQYHAAGLQARTRDMTNPLAPKVLWALGENSDLRGGLYRQLLGNGVMTERSYTSTNGRLNRIQSGRLVGNGIAGWSGNVQDLGFEFDTLGNLYERNTARTGLNGEPVEYAAEMFTYDDLNRLKTSNTNWVPAPPNARGRTYNYDPLGNLTYRSDLGTLTYDQSHNGGAHAVTFANGKEYHYDDYGNLIKRGTAASYEMLEYDVFNKPTRIGSTYFSYGPNHQRFKQVSGSRTVYYINGGEYEEIVESGATTQRSHVGGFLVRSTTASGATLTYLHKDHIGSTEAMTDQSGNLVDRMSFDPWGMRQLTNWASPTSNPPWGNPGDPDHYPTTKGFTGHEMVDQVNLIHMNGRVYDPVIGRFLSPDIVVQAPFNSQSFNRYSYVMNNPLSLVDPSGYMCGPSGGTAYNMMIQQFAYEAASFNTQMSFAMEMQSQMYQQYRQAQQYRQDIQTLKDFVKDNPKYGSVEKLVQRFILSVVSRAANSSQKGGLVKVGWGGNKPGGTTVATSKETLVKAYGDRSGQSDVILFGVRPLDMNNADSIAKIDGSLAQDFNATGVHVEVIVITKDGDVITRGFHGGGKGYTADPRFDHFLSTGQYSISKSMTLLPNVSGMNILNQIGSLPRFSDPNNYNFLTNNCQSYAGRVHGAALESGLRNTYY